MEILATALIRISALWCEATPELQVSTCGAKEEFTLFLYLYCFLVAYMTPEEHLFKLLLKCPKLFQGFFF